MPFSNGHFYLYLLFVAFINLSPTRIADAHQPYFYAASETAFCRVCSLTSVG